MKHRQLKRFLSLLIAIGMVAALTACQTSAAPPAASQGGTSASTSGGSDSAASGGGEVITIKIGCLYGMTGNNASLAAQYFGSVQAAADIINNAHPGLGDYPFAATEGLPGLGGAKIELIVADTQSNPEVGATECERLITEVGVDVVMGGHLSGVAKTSSAAAERLQTPYMAGASSSPSLTERGLQYFFRCSPHDGTHAVDVFDMLDEYKDQYSLKTIAICCEEAEFGKLNQEIWQRMAAERGYEIVENFTYPSTPASVTAECIKLKSANPDVILMSTQVSENILFTRTFKEMDINPKMIIGAKGGHVSQDWFDACGEDTEFVMTTNAWSMDLAEAKPYTNYINDLVKQYSGVELTGDFAREIDSFMVLMDAINRAGSTDKEAVRKALGETKLGSEWLLCPWEGVEFGQDHQNIYSNGVITQVQGGTYVSVYPTATAYKEPIIPMPAWTER